VLLLHMPLLAGPSIRGPFTLHDKVLNNYICSNSAPNKAL
jgi:hypothetical protein